MKFQQELETMNGQANPPKWASKATHYFENEHREQWIAHVEDGYLYISGLDIDWEVMKGDYSQVVEYLEISEEIKKITKKTSFVELNQLLERRRKNAFCEYSLNLPEEIWFKSVMESSLMRLENAYKKMEIAEAK